MQHFHRFVIQLLTIATLAGAQAQSPGPVTLAIDSFIEANEISGAVTLVAKDGEIVRLEARGKADMANNRRMKQNNLFWIASMTKPLTGAAILLLQDQGKLSTDDLVEQHLSEFSDLWLIDQKSPNQQTLKRPSRKITLKDLLTHTSGVPNVSIPRAHSTLGEVVSIVSQQPLQFEPGSRWSYSNAGMDTLGHIVEVISGQSFDEFLNDQFFKPLGMQHTSFHPSKRQSSRLAKTYQKDKETGALKEAKIHILKAPLWDKQRTVRPAGGLFSTAEDLFYFYQMMLNRGVWKGNRILSEEAINELTKTQTGDIKTGFTEGMSWGLGFQVVKAPQGVTSMLSPGTFGHGGAYATQSWADPVHQSIYILMIQRRGFPNGDNSPVRKAFQQAATQLLGNQ
jgi:CubicO group peptidase (beta-lactamase class C family)